MLFRSNKGIVVDSSRVALGSHNWSVDGTTTNRDATLIIDDGEVAKYYEKLFLYDWNNLARQNVPGERAMPRVRRSGEGARGAEMLSDGVRAKWKRMDWSEYLS